MPKANFFKECKLFIFGMVLWFFYLATGIIIAAVGAFMVLLIAGTYGTREFLSWLEIQFERFQDWKDKKNS